MVCNLSVRYVLICNLSVKHRLVYKFNFRAVLVYSLDLIKQVSYKTSNSIKFKRAKGFIVFDII